MEPQLVEEERAPLAHTQEALNGRAEAGGGGGGSARPLWLTVDGPLGVEQEGALSQARNFFYAGFLMLPWLWFVNCFYFWPVLCNRQFDPVLRSYIVRSAIGFSVYTSLLLVWALTFAIGGERMFGSSWKNLAVYDLADSYDFLGS